MKKEWLGWSHLVDIKFVQIVVLMFFKPVIINVDFVEEDCQQNQCDYATEFCYIDFNQPRNEKEMHTVLEIAVHNGNNHVLE